MRRRNGAMHIGEFWRVLGLEVEDARNCFPKLPRSSLWVFSLEDDRTRVSNAAVSDDILLTVCGGEEGASVTFLVLGDLETPAFSEVGFVASRVLGGANNPDLARRRVVVGGGEGAARFCATFRVMRLGCRLLLRLGMFFPRMG